MTKNSSKEKKMRVTHSVIIDARHKREKAGREGNRDKWKRQPAQSSMRRTREVQTKAYRTN